MNNDLAEEPEKTKANPYSTKLTFKFLVVGDSDVGKTCIFRRFTDDTFSDFTQTTIGVDYRSQLVTINDQQIKLQIWDTAGQEKYRSVGKGYYRNAVGALLVFSLSSHDSFDSLGGWLNEIRQYARPQAKVVLIGNKVDLIDDRQVTSSEASAFAMTNHLLYIETSAKTNTNVHEAFLSTARFVYRSVVNNEIILEIPVAETSIEFDSDFMQTAEEKKQKCKC